jgi:hypothetical protein
MKYRVLKNTIADGKPVRAGEIIELSQSEARTLMGYGRAVPHHEDVRTTNVVEDVVHRDPVSKRGGKRKNGA